MKVWTLKWAWQLIANKALTLCCHEHLAAAQLHEKTESNICTDISFHSPASTNWKLLAVDLKYLFKIRQHGKPLFFKSPPWFLSLQMAGKYGGGVGEFSDIVLFEDPSKRWSSKTAENINGESVSQAKLDFFMVAKRNHSCLKKASKVIKPYSHLWARILSLCCESCCASLETPPQHWSWYT